MRRTLHDLGQWLAYVAVRIVVCAVQMLSMDSCRWWCQVLAWFVGGVIGLRRQVVSDNLARAFPEKSHAERRRIARQMWEHLFLMVCELAHLQRKLHDTNWRRFIRMESRDVIVGSLLDPRPTVVVSGHFGNFELGCYLIGLLGFRGYAIARPLDNRFLDRFVRRFRESKGQFILDKDGCAQQIAERLKEGETLVLLGDQFAGQKGCWVDFFGQPASCHKGVALFTLTSGAPMEVLAVVRQQRPLDYAVELAGHVDPRALPAELSNVKGLTRWYNACLENKIRKYPAQYWWLHRRWKGQPPAKRTAVAPSEAGRSEAGNSEAGTAESRRAAA